jgi:hypothetical protein
MSRFGSLAATLFVAACMSTQPAPVQHSDVRITTNPQATTGCTYLKDIVSSKAIPTLMGSNSIEDERERVLAVLREDAAKIGADTVFLQGWAKRRAKGEAYRCGAAKVDR